MATRLTQSHAARLVLVAALFIAACEAGPVQPVGRRTGGLLEGGGAGGAVNTALQGTWQRTLVFFDDVGFLHSSETTWTFGPGGSATRTIVTTNHTLGAADTSVTVARWRLDGTSVVIDFTAPSPGTIVLDVRVQGTTLFLAGQEYRRIS